MAVMASQDLSLLNHDRADTARWQVETADAAEVELMGHLEALGLETVEAYQAWCFEYGFRQTVVKSLGEQRRERAFAADLEADGREKAGFVAPSGADVVRVFKGDMGDKACLRRISAAIESLETPGARRAFQTLLLRATVRAPELFQPGMAIYRLGRNGDNTFVAGMAALARHHRDWLYPPTSWESAGEDPLDVFESLAEHLFSNYEIPGILFSAWFRGSSRVAERQQDWFKHIGRGKHLRTAKQPPRLNQKMAHCFLESPVQFSIEEAMRWGQVIGRGGDGPLAEAAIDSALGRSFRNEDFWSTVLQFLVNNPMLDPACVGPLVGFLEAQKFERRELVCPDGKVIRLKSPHSRLQMKGRSLRKLLRGTGDWLMHLPEGDDRSGQGVLWSLQEAVLRSGKDHSERLMMDPTVHIQTLGFETVEDYRTWCRDQSLSPGLFKTWQAQRQEIELVRHAASSVLIEAQVNGHVEGLGFETAEAYQAWCREHYFSDTLIKPRRQQRREIRLMEKIRGEAVLSGARDHARRPRQTILQIYEGRLKEVHGAYFQKIQDGFAEFEGDAEAREAFLQLVLHATAVGDLSGMEKAISRLGRQPGNTFVEGLVALARHRTDWIRPVEAWSPPSYNPRKQFGSLARHLLAQYEVPGFMDTAWFLGEEANQQGWFKHVGSGGNIRTADIPVHLTKMMAHWFLQAPGYYTLEEAFRWGQVLGMGGSEHLVKAVIGTRLGRVFEHEDFWATVVRFLVNSSMLDPAYVKPIVDYIYVQKFAPSEIVLPGGEVRYGPPPHPNFSIKDRSRMKLIRAVDKWLDYQNQEAALTTGDWKSSGFEGFEYQTRHPRTRKVLTWTVNEVLTNQELAAEAREMRHCVMSYAKRCQRGSVSVWSLQRKVGKGHPVRVMTIAVDNKRKLITQHRGKFNAHPMGDMSGEARWQKLDRADRIYLQGSEDIVKMWADREGLE